MNDILNLNNRVRLFQTHVPALISSDRLCSPPLGPIFYSVFVGASSLLENCQKFQSTIYGEISGSALFAVRTQCSHLSIENRKGTRCSVVFCIEVWQSSSSVPMFAHHIGFWSQRCKLSHALAPSANFAPACARLTASRCHFGKEMTRTEECMQDSIPQ